MYLIVEFNIQIWRDLYGYSLFHDGGPYYIETSPVTGFYMVGTYVRSIWVIRVIF